jgi:hypothetical protein
MRNVSDKSKGNQDTFLCFRNVLRKSCRLRGNGGGNMAEPVLSRKDAVFMPLNQGKNTDRHTHTHTQNINAYCFFTAVMVTPTRLGVNVIRTLPVLFPVCFPSTLLCSHHTSVPLLYDTNSITFLPNYL